MEAKNVFDTAIALYNDYRLQCETFNCELPKEWDKLNAKDKLPWIKDAMQGMSFPEIKEYE